MNKPAVRIIVDLLRLYRTLLRYCYLRVCYIGLHIRYYALILERAVLLEVLEIRRTIKSMSKENRVIFAACIAVSIYGLALITLIRM